MQNVVLGAFAYKITGSPVFVSLLTFAQLVPLLLLSIVGGTLADIFDRRKLLILVSIEQTAFALAIAWIAACPHPSTVGLFLCTLAIGIGQAVYAPTFGSLVPQLVDKKDLAGAVSLNSVNMNLSRVIGPAIGGAHLRRLRHLVGVHRQRRQLPVHHRCPADGAAARGRSATRPPRPGCAGCSAASSPPERTTSSDAAC